MQLVKIEDESFVVARTVSKDELKSLNAWDKILVSDIDRDIYKLKKLGNQSYRGAVFNNVFSNNVLIDSLQFHDDTVNNKFNDYFVIEEKTKVKDFMLFKAEKGNIQIDAVDLEKQKTYKLQAVQFSGVGMGKVQFSVDYKRHNEMFTVNTLMRNVLS